MVTSQPIFRLPPFKVEGAFVSLSETVDWGLSLLKVPDQWKKTAGEGISVAVLDTGIDTQHPDLKEAIDEVRDFTRSYFGAADRNGHGTHVAGTIAARRNGFGVVGVAPECRLLIGKVLGDDGSGSDESVAAGIDWAANSKARIISMSLGSPFPSSRIYAAIQRAVERGKFVICAAGNDGLPNSVNYPAKWDETVGVGAVDRDGKLSKFSSQGPEVDICAPGEGILSTYLNGSYARLSGTSMATPFVSGVVALLLAKHVRQGGKTPVTTQKQLLEHLHRTATDMGPIGQDPEYGYGLIDPERLLADAAGPIVPQLTIGPVTVNGLVGSFVFVPEHE